jgi:hypothetical protein
MRVFRRVFAVALVAAAAGACVGGQSAWAAEPWWHLEVGARPSVLHAPTDGVQEITTGEGNFVLAVVELEGQDVACLSSEFIVNSPEFKAFVEAAFCNGAELDDDAAQFQASLNKHYGASVAEVTGKSGGPGSVGSGEPMLVTSRGRNLAPMKLPVNLGGFTSAVVSEGGSGRLLLVAFNLGDAPTSGPVTLTDTLPAGLTATGVVGSFGYAYLGGKLPEASNDPRAKCSLSGASSVSCTFEEASNEGVPLPDVLLPYERLEVVVWVSRSETAVSGEHNVLSVSGGGAREVSKSSVVSYGDGPVPFGVEAYEQEPEEEGGVADTQAGSHPFQLTTTLRANETGSNTFQPAMPRNLQFDLPPGFVGDAQATPQCTYAQFMTFTFGLLAHGREGVNLCPADTAIGVSMQESLVGKQGRGLFIAESVPVFNLTPARGEPARFGFVIHNVPVILDTSIRTGGDYGVRVTIHNLPETAATVLSSVVSICCVTGDPRHDQQRGWACLFEEQPQQPGCSPSLGSRLPLLSMPTACEPFQAPMRMQSWKPGAELLPPVDSAFEEVLDGCNKLPFGALVEAAPDVQSASSPSGLTVHVRVPQEAALNSNGLTDADVRDSTVALPAGVTLNPGGGAGLEACSETQIGFLGKEASDPALNLFTASLAEPFCPNGAKVATVKVVSPLLPDPLEGSVYIATPAPDGEAGMNPFDTLVAMYIVAEDPVSGTLIKIPGRVMLCERTGEVLAGVSCGALGQLISTFEDTPQLPFEDLELHFFGGSNAPLATPALCGSYTTSATFVPWSGGAPVRSTSTFDITSGPGGSPCADPRPFNPEFQAGMVNIQAGAFSELRTTMGHPDADQELGGLSVKMPPGLSGLLSGVTLCGEPQAAQGTCGPQSLIGHTVVTAGLGSSPVVVKRPGGVYITGPYKGAPFGLSIVNPAEAGPFNLGNVVVRARIEVDPLTAQLTVVSDPLPTILKGIPLDLQHVQVAIDRSAFTFNPTNCDPMRVEGSMSSDEGASAPVSVPFQVTDCATLAFKPGFKVSTSGRTSRAKGASLSVRLTYPKAPFGSQANIKSVKVELPRQLPSNLKTLQKACTVAIFEANPAACPAGSVVGHARAITPLLPVALEGPAYFVSYGGAKFPELVIVLRGYGVTLDLHGETFISKAGITSSTFKTVPDAPVGSFELTLPQGPDSALAANGNLCKAKLKMPTVFTAQNGATIKQSTPIVATGCPKHKAKARRANHRHRHRRHHARRGG